MHCMESFAIAELCEKGYWKLHAHFAKAFIPSYKTFYKGTENSFIYTVILAKPKKFRSTY